MYIGDLIGVQDATKLLKISRPKFDKIRRQYNLREFKVGKKLLFSKIEILQQAYVGEVPQEAKFDFCLGNLIDFDVLKIDESSYDLRRIGLMDGHGAISFVCHLMSCVKQSNCYVHLVLDESTSWLRYFNFFGVLKQFLNSKIFWDETVLSKVPDIDFSEWIRLPITRLGIAGAQTKITDDLTVQLAAQGYSDDVCAYIGWAMGELCDNAATHAGVHPSFVQFTQVSENKKYLLFTIGDVGIGIPNSLRKNPKYSQLNDEKAVLTAFKPYVSGRADEEKRGKGLTDVLKIAMECSSILQVESNNIGYGFQFNAGIDSFIKCKPFVKSHGTVISVLFIDGNFASFEREDVDSYIDKCLEKI